jgi:hypothetical protein
MKRMFVAGLLALAALAGSQNQASAWCKWNFNAGINWSYEGGGNSLLWGAWQSSPSPCCGVPGCVLQGQPFNNYACCQPGPLAYPPVPYAAPGYPAAPIAPVGPVAPKPVAQPGVGQASVHPVSYTNYSQYYQSYGTSYYGGQVPSYWYGR